MKLIIDLDEYDYSTIVNDERYMPLDISVAIKNGTPIPYNATVCDIEQIRADIEQLHYHPKLDFIKNDEVVDMALDVIDRYKGDKE